MRRRSRREERQLREAAEELVAEAEAMLAGRAKDPAIVDGRVPIWVWVNILAHADLDSLRALDEDMDSHPRSGWEGAVGFLAAEVLSAFSTADDLEDAQRAVFIPIELDLLGGADGVNSPATLVSVVTARLNQYRHQRPLTGARPRTT